MSSSVSRNCNSGGSVGKSGNINGRSSINKGADNGAIPGIDATELGRTFANKWWIIGMKLRLPEEKLDCIAEAHTDASQCGTSMLREWLARHSPLEELLEVLESPAVGLRRVAAQIKEVTEAKENSSTTRGNNETAKEASRVEAKQAESNGHVREQEKEGEGDKHQRLLECVSRCASMLDSSSSVEWEQGIEVASQGIELLSPSASTGSGGTTDSMEVSIRLHLTRATLMWKLVIASSSDSSKWQRLEKCQLDCEEVTRIARSNTAKYGQDEFKGLSLLYQCSLVKGEGPMMAHYRRLLVERGASTVVLASLERDALGGGGPGTTISRSYHLQEMLFPKVSFIEQPLLEGVIECYKKRQTVCRNCFYNDLMLSRGFNAKGQCTTCNWEFKNLLVIPKSPLTVNYYKSDMIAIPPWPRSKPNDLPFESCAKPTDKSQEHKRCLIMSRNSAVWYAHTVEELVIWTVEREFGYSFEDFVEQHGKPFPPHLMPHPPHPLQSFPPAPPHLQGRSPNQLPPPPHVPMSGRSHELMLPPPPPPTDQGFRPHPHDHTINSVVGSHDLSGMERDLPIRSRGFAAMPSQGPPTTVDEPLPIGSSRELPLMSRNFPPVSSREFSVSQRDDASKLQPSQKTQSRSWDPLLTDDPLLRDTNHWSPWHDPLESLVTQTTSNGSGKKLEPIVSVSKMNGDVSVNDPLREIWSSPLDRLQKPMESLSISSGHSVQSRSGHAWSSNWSTVNSSPSGLSRATAAPGSQLLSRGMTNEEKPLYKKPLYSVSQVRFTSFAGIPNELIQSVAYCFTQHMTVCQTCFHNYSWLPGNPVGCHHQDASLIIIMPRSPLCAGNRAYVAIGSRPHSYTAQMGCCSNLMHRSCHDSSRWCLLPHSVEEHVIWLVEMDTGFQFKQFCEQYLTGTSFNRDYQPQKWYSLTNSTFKSCSEVPPQLLQSVQQSYRAQMTVCQSCFHQLRPQTTVELSRLQLHGNERACGLCGGHYMEQMIMPASELCRNQFGKFVPISFDDGRGYPVRSVEEMVVRLMHVEGKLPSDARWMKSSSFDSDWYKTMNSM